MKRKIEITEQGMVHVVNGMEEWVMDFNERFEGFFPKCHFHSSCYNEKTFYISGSDNSGTPYVFSSECGNIWTMENIQPINGLFQKKDYGQIIFMLWDKQTNQLYLVSRRGYLIVLPDCPKCVRVRKIIDSEADECWAEDREIGIRDCSGKVKRFYIETMAQYRCAWSFAKPHINKDGILIDLRGAQSRGEAPVLCSFYCEGAELEKLMENYPREKHLFFICEHGYLADEAAREARASGIRSAYSLGGVYNMEDE